MSQFQIPLILRVEADTCDEAQRIAEGFCVVNDKLTVVTDFEHDNDGQRVLYLHGENDPIK